MQINPINLIYFNGKRKDHNTVKKLSTSTEPINENLQINMLKALDALSQDASTQNIKFLLSTAKNLNYGVKSNSEFKKRLLASSPLENSKQLSNTDWESSLKAATRKAIDLNEDADKSDLEKGFKRAFVWNSGLSNIQRDILEFREKITKSYILRNEIAQINPEMVNNVKKNLDYFIFSSEISQHDKAECLLTLTKFVSSQYKINPQLKDKKLQVLDEILNDIIIKTPEAQALTIKNVNQRQHGMCAAIAACRKLAAYQDKPNYIENIMEELNSSPYMYIYDITQLGTGRKIPVKKAHIDFDDAIKHGYRIIDAATTQWMNNSKRTGDGADITSYYVPFDADNYELYKDSFWLANLPDSMGYSRSILKNAIKARSIAEDIDKFLAHKESLNETVATQKHSLIIDINKNKIAMESALAELLPQKNNDEIKAIISRILSLDEASQKVSYSSYKKTSSENPIYLINPSEPDDCKKSKIALFISDVTELPREIVSENMDKIYVFYSNIKENEQKLSDIVKINSAFIKTRDYYKNLFLFSVAYQKALEANMNNSEFVQAHIRRYNLPSRDENILNHFDNLIEELQQPVISEDTDLPFIAQILKTKSDKDSVLDGLKQFRDDFENTVNSTYDKVCKKLGFKDVNDFTANVIKAYLSQVETKDKTEIAKIAEYYKLAPTKDAVARKLSELITKVKNHEFDNNIQQVLSGFNIKNLNSYLMIVVQSIYTMGSAAPETTFVKSPMYYLVKDILDKAKEQNYDLAKELPYISADLANLQENIDVIESGFDVPLAHDLVWDKFIKDGIVIPNEDFDDLDNKFLEIEQKNDELAKAKLNNKKLRFPELYSFTEHQKDILKKMESNYARAKHYINRTYKDITKKYQKELDKAYREAGLVHGSFWIGEEGSTGLRASSQVKIIEQMTGKPYHMEKNLLTAIRKIKDGIGGGEISTFVSAKNMETAHAQFTPAITSEKITDKKTGKTIIKDVLWFDNSWGHREHENTWQDELGITHTDYENGYGADNGFILRKNDMIGLATDFLLYAKGVNRPGLINNGKEKKVNKNVGEEYPIFMDIILPGQSPMSKKVTRKLVDDIFDIPNDKKRLEALISKIDKKQFPELKKYGDDLDEVASQSSEKLLKRAMAIKSEEEFNALPDDDELKIVLTKLSILDTFYGDRNDDAVNQITKPEEFNTYNRKLLNKLKKFTLSYLGHDIQMYNQPELTDKLKSYIERFEKKHKIDLKDMPDKLQLMFVIKHNNINKNKTLLNNIAFNTAVLAKKFAPNKTLAKELQEGLLNIIAKYHNDNFSTELLLHHKEFKPILTFLDNMYDPASDKDAVNLVEKLRRTKYEDIKKVISKAKLKDFGITYNKPYHYLKVMQTESWEAKSDFTSAASKLYLYKFIPKPSRIKVALGTKFDKIDNTKLATADRLYRILQVSLSYAEVEKLIDRQKNEVFDKYAVREAFPRVKSFPLEKVHNTVDENLTNISIHVDKIKAFKQDLILADLIKEYQTVYGAKKDITKEYVTEKIIPILEKIDANIKKTDIGIVASNISNNIIYSLEKVEFNRIKEMLAELNKEIDTVKNDFTVENIKNNINAEVENINTMIKYFAKAFIIHKKKQDEFIHLLHEYVKQYSKDPLCDKQENIINKLHSIVEDYVFLKTPALLLKEFLKLKIHDVKNNSNEHEREIKVYKDALDGLLDAANFIDVQYKILEEIESGRIYDFKKNLEDYRITLEDDSEVELLSPRGVGALFKALFNEADPNHMGSVNLLSQNTGLAEDFFNSLEGKYDFSSHKKYCIAFQNRMNKTINEVAVIEEAFKYISKNTNMEYEDLATKYLEFVLDTFGENDRCKTLQVYKKAFLSLAPSFVQISKNIKNTPAVNYAEKREKLSKELLRYNHKKAINAVVTSMQDKLTKMKAHVTAIDGDLQILENIKLADFSELLNKQQKYIKGMNTLRKFEDKLANKAEEILIKMYDEDIENKEITLELT